MTLLHLVLSGSKMPLIKWWQFGFHIFLSRWSNFIHFVLIKTLKAEVFFNILFKTKLFSYIVNLKLETVQKSNWSEFQISINFLTINPISGLIGQIYWLTMDLSTKIVDLTRMLLERIGVANIHILSRPHVLVGVPVQFRAMRLGGITHMPLLGPVTRLWYQTELIIMKYPQQKSTVVPKVTKISLGQPATGIKKLSR